MHLYTFPTSRGKRHGQSAWIDDDPDATDAVSTCDVVRGAFPNDAQSSGRVYGEDRRNRPAHRAATRPIGLGIVASGPSRPA